MMCQRLKVSFVLHVMQVAGAEVLVAETIRRLGSRIDPLVRCLDGVGQLGGRMQAEGVPVVARMTADGVGERAAFDGRAGADRGDAVMER